MDQLAPLLGVIRERGITVIANAGGVNPSGCAEAVFGAASSLGLPLTVAVVDGDDLMGRLDELLDGGVRFDNLETGETFGPKREQALSANAYFGAEPVVRALAHRPDVVVTGRVTDTGITLAALRSAFGWDPGDWDRIAGGIVAGHLIECGVQATGGNFTDWERVPGLGRQGFPIVEVEEDGRFVLTTQPGTEGLVSEAVVREQLLYEMGDPERYLCPDATVDFSRLTTAAEGRNRVRVEGARGAPPPPDLKVSASVAGGFAARGALVLGGPDVRAKAAALEAAFRQRLKTDCDAAGVPGAGGTAGGSRRRRRRPARVSRSRAGRALGMPGPLRRLEPGAGAAARVPQAAADPDPERAAGPRRHRRRAGGVRGGRLLAGAGPAGPRPGAGAGVSGVRRRGRRARGRGGSAVRRADGAPGRFPPAETPRRPPPGPTDSGPTALVPLGAVAHARGGDKGDAANIGVIGRSAACYGWLRENLTAPLLAEWARGVAAGEVRRYEIPGLRALNFVLERALGGGGTRSLLLDPQGKTLAAGLLRRRVRVPTALLDTIAREDRPLSPAFAISPPGQAPDP